LTIAIDQRNTFGNNSLSRLPYNSSEFEMVYNEGLAYDLGEELATTSSNASGKKEVEELTLKKTFKNIPIQNLSVDKIRKSLEEYKKIVGFDEKTGQFNDYEKWLEVGSILHHQFRGEEEGLSLWKEISCEEGHTIEYTYKKFSSDKENPKTFKSIMKVIRDNKTPSKTSMVDSKDSFNRIDKSIRVSIDTFPHLHHGKTITKPQDTYDNFVHLMKFYKVDLRFDIITKKITLYGKGNQNEFQEDILDLMELNNMSSKARGMRYISRYAFDNRYNSFYNLLTETKWDGVCRLDEFYNTLKVKPEYVELRNLYLLTWLKQFIYTSCFNNIYPNERKKICKLLLVLQSKQNGGKSTWVANLLPPEMQEKYVSIGATLKTDDDRHMHGVINKLIVELGEIEKSFKHSDINAFKAFYGRTLDTLKVIYVATPVSFERTTSFIATTNDLYFLRDITGSTRFMVLPLDDDYKNEKGLSIFCNGKHDIDMLMLYRQVLESEDWIDFELNEDYRQVQEEVNNQFTMNDTMEDLFFEEFSKEKDETAPLFNCTEILKKLGYGTSHINKKLRNELATMLRKYKFPYVECLKKFKLQPLRKEIKFNNIEF
jgi:predicted P-loop ATPase